MTPLRQRYVEDLQVRNYSPRTVQCYVHHVASFAKHFGRSPEQLGPEEVHAYQVFGDGGAMSGDVPAARG